MKHLNITFEDEEYERILKNKGKKGWREFVLERCGSNEDKEEVKTNGE